MNRLDPEQIDRQLGEWLRDESSLRAPARLVEDVFAQTSRTRQSRPWWPLDIPGISRGARPEAVGAGRALGPLSGSALAGALSIVLVVAVLGLVLRPGGTGPGTSGLPNSSSPSPVGTTSPTPSRAATPTPSGSPSPTPVSTTIGALSAQSLSLGIDAGPIEVTEAFGSIWVADIHANDIRRYDPATFEELNRIPTPGAAWFAEADDALWVTNQTGAGLQRIDPQTNTAVTVVGAVPPCGAPVVAFESLWQAACDAQVILRIDPTTNTVIDSIPAQGHSFLVFAGGRLITTGSEGLASLDPETGVFTTIGNQAAAGPAFMTSDGATVWVKNGAGMARIDPADGRTIAGFSYPDAQAVSFAGDHAWLTVRGVGVLEIDLATNRVRRTIPVRPAPLVPLEADGVLWVTDFESSALWRIVL